LREALALVEPFTACNRAKRVPAAHSNASFASNALQVPVCCVWRWASALLPYM
jgi:hypothetical protein